VAERTESLAVVNRRFETALAASGVTVFTQDENLAYTWMSHDVIGLPAEAFVGRTDAEMLPPEVLPQVRPLKEGVLRTGVPARGEVAVREQWFDLTVEPLRDGPGIICGAVDITRRKQDEQRIRFLLDEVKHRVGNLLGVAQAMLRQTAADSATVEELVERFGLRLRSLAGSQQLLVREGSQAATLREVVDAQLGHFAGEGASQLTVEGPALKLEDTAVLHIGMALHELATNAAKYGALSVPEGRVRVSWAAADGRCHLRWRESGGPPVRPSERRGFGREVMEWAVAQAVGGEVALDFHPEGVRWDLRFPLTEAALAA
jgi:two-component sensor histidine kinase